MDSNSICDILSNFDPDENHFTDMSKFNSCKFYDINYFLTKFTKNHDSFYVFNFKIRCFFKNFEEFSSLILREKNNIGVIILTETYSLILCFSLL